MKTEKVFGLILLVGLLFKFMHWPFSGPLLVIGLGILSMLYLVGGFYFFSDKQLKTQNITLSIIAGLFLSIACIAILFKLMFWPFSGSHISIAIVTVPILLIIALWFKSKNQEELETYYKNMIIRLSVWTFLVVLFYFTSSITLVKIIHSDDPEWIRLQTQTIMYPENKSFQAEYQEYVKSQ